VEETVTNGTNTQNGKAILMFLVTALLAMSVFLNVFLARKIASLRAENSRMADSDRLRVAPTTIVISPEGKVLKVWTGAYRDGLRQEIEAFLGVHLLRCCDGGALELKTKS